MSISGLALATLLKDDQLLAKELKPDLERHTFDLLPRKPQFKPRARAMISMFMQGGPSQMDLMDPKPMLNKYDGTIFPEKIKYDNAAQSSSEILGVPWKFKKHGECGTDLSELLPHLAKVVDDITIIRSMHTGVNNHGASIMALNSGMNRRGRPTVGSWLCYGLGSEARDLPAFVALNDSAGLAERGPENWSNGWLPSVYQGTPVRSQEPRILNLDPPVHLSGTAQKRYLTFLDGLNQKHLEEHPGEFDLEARIANYELAAQMQLAAKDAMDIRGESEYTKKLYGIDKDVTREFSTRCLIARRLVERGVRCVQLFTPQGRWDHHGKIRSRLPESCGMTDQGTAALIIDLKERGLLDTTVVHWGGEMGRLPVIQNPTGPDKVGRDHNTYGFSMWVAGGGFKKGYVHGETDEWGHRAVKDVVNHYDYHATLLHLFGLDYKNLVFHSNGRERSLVDNQPARVIHDLIA